MHFYTRCKMHRTPVLLKNYSFHNFLNRSNFAFVCFFSKKIFSPQKMFLSCLCLRHGAYLNSTSNVFAHLLIIFLGHYWFGFFLTKWAISHINYWDQVNSWKNLWKFWNGPLCRNKSGPSPLLNVAVYWQSSDTETCVKKLSQILANNIDNGGRGLVSEFMWGIF